MMIINKHNKCMISTHAPVKGATLKWQDRRKRLFISTHAPVKGATLQTAGVPINIAFQLTHP